MTIVLLFVASALVVLYATSELQQLSTLGVVGTVNQTISKIGWPSGDAIWNIAQAIATQEGFGADSGNGPTRNHNPGDISDGASTYGHDPLITDSQVTSFPDDSTGWQWLYNKLLNIAQGNSSVYDPSTSWVEFGSHWASDPNWPAGVCSVLGVDPSTSMNDYLTAQGWQ